MKTIYKIIHSDVYSSIKNLENSSIDISITSPPYWGQRDYGFEGQIGNEKNYIEYISKLVKIFNLLKEKMNEKGVFFLNIGDKYLSKYGKSPLGLIPYKLAYYMVKDGWYLNDIIIWYKPNHMPSSVKNRFTNSYEPIFVFSKSKNNYFSEFNENNTIYSNILKVNLQPSQYKHVAVYPENLVVNLLEMVTLNEGNTILDMFAGSGTTLKVVKDFNESILFNKKLNAIMIENNLDYINIIKKRCNLENIIEDHCNYIKYEYDIIKECYNINIKNQINIDIDRKGFFKIFEKKLEFYNFVSNILNNNIKNKLDLNATCFLGSKEFDIDLIYNMSYINENGWIIRNLLAVENNNKWFPVFMIIDDNKKQNNLFNFKNLELKHKTEDNIEWSKFDFVGHRVLNNLLKDKIIGYIVKILEFYNNGLPKYVIVKWENDKLTKEFVINSQEEINQNIKIIYDNNYIFLKEDRQFIDLNNSYKENFDSVNILCKINKKEYNGKFKEEKRINWGASPGARASNEEVYFSKQRLYDVDQQLISDYLNNLRIKKGLSKKQLIDFFPDNYYHTVGHWLRKDFGGSIPLPEDWELLIKILEIDKSWTNYVCKTALKIQTVKKGEYKLPKDFVEISLLNKLECLIK